MSPPYTALINGSNGITGQAMVSALLSQPSSKWTQIIITSRSPLFHSSTNSPRLSGLQLDLSATSSITATSLRKFPGIENVTHFYHCAYIHHVDADGMINPMVNVGMFENILKAVDEVCGKLERVFLQCGAKYYGVHIGNEKGINGEGIREEDGKYGGQDSIFYYGQVDFMKGLSEKRGWGWNFGNPFWVYGPSQGNGKNINTTFPGRKQLYEAKYSLSGNKGIGEFQEWLTTQENTKNEYFNVVDGCDVTLGQIWESMCEYFAIPTTPPSSGTEWNIEKFMKDKREVWDEIVDKYGGKKEAFGWGTYDTARSTMSDLHLLASMEKAKRFGWDRVYDTRMELSDLFDNMMKEGSLPDMK